MVSEQDEPELIVSEDGTVKRVLGFGAYLAGGALCALASQPAYAADTVITGVEVVPTDRGAQVILQTESGKTPDVFAAKEGQSLRVDLPQTQLRLPEGDRFIQQNPAPGIVAIAIVPLDDTTVRLMVDGEGLAPVATLEESQDGDLLVAISTDQTIAPSAVPQKLVTIGEQQVKADKGGAIAPEPINLLNLPKLFAQAENQPTEAQVEADPNAPQPDVLVPNPAVVIDGIPVPAPSVQRVPPFLPSAVPPPVGDVAVRDVVPTFGEIDLGSTQRVPRLVLRDAPAREVLSLLARAAGLNLVFIDQGDQGQDAGAGDGQQGGAAAPTGEGPPITLDIENESVQDVFNSVLRVSGLQANRVGRTIYVGPSLPNSAQNIVMRSLRLNQVDAGVASNFLVGLGAERAVSREREVQTVTAVDIEEGLTDRQVERTVEQIIQTDRADFEDSVPIFRGLQVVAEERTNSITLVGTPSLVELATAELVRLDLRRRQVAVNVKVLDVDLNALDAFSTSFSFGSGDASVSSQGGVGVINFGDRNPSGTTSVPGSTPFGSIPVFGGGIPFVPDDFLFQLYATVQEGNTKILTDPTLIVQEGQVASVQLTEEVVTNFDVKQNVTDTGQVTQAITVEKEPAGLILQVNVDRIDDNGFVTLSVAPTITAPIGIETFSFTGVSNAFVTLLAERQLSSGQIRVRDGQTLLLSGIIQETDRTTASKIPILGDIPILGALFRSSRTENQRKELIVLLTPQILDDTDQSVWGYSYTPSAEVQELLERSRQRQGSNGDAP